MNPKYIQALRKEAEEQAKKILKDQKYFSKKDLLAKESTVKKFKRSKHVLLKQSDIDHCINNGLDVMYLYDEMASKYGGDDNRQDVKKKYYQPTGKPKGRRKKDNNGKEE